ncbi:uncharacterized protein LOC111039048 isoform X2 [Myzus persicae]|uniref:uncharacterized protein LOC111039048 isoform X2 n=1 Tax=Myzus persicae TaxID=13164 RepID=UPI000B932B49|nr:uncharacterized protein LOC111039048 isoform X2 [Myzus persicae]
MTEHFVSFHIRCKKELFEMKIKPPIDLPGFVESLKNELKLDEIDDIVVLFPVADGKMMEIQSDDDFEFFKNNKIIYDAEEEQICCNVELVVIIVHRLPDDPNAKFQILSNRLDQLTSQVDKLSDIFNKKMNEDNSSVVAAIFRSILAENSEIDLGNKLKKKSPGEPSKLNSSNLKPENGQHKKKTKKGKEKSSSTSTFETNLVNLD